ncbi:hypothetical protein AM501_00675 [Aneurinibacillus migulanus]|uniref:restriction endonuclease, SacI family n=1 Tax=Aneurinibacillus migulanus TaxID=47500 RepID=UPI0005BA89D1|nr:restriction endonuclease, SacI family [Aneurinibacillus migulanus]KIV59266.1 hypothetical protein TS64_02385 [Aneurinibacillus migulanus]KPD10097.1 hypothetical protein AM501_00675 [Aneurinibacillus migulanus]CEH28023.1 SacI restriction endonuclease [Aneurinibacillus migulanus]
MDLEINKAEAKEILNKAFENATTDNYQPCSPFATEVNTILSETHLTYKYIMVTALLAKATSSKINPLCLQKGSKLEGAYDARSVCHQVVVPFEREKLFNAFGGSNEPFLNKPARIPELSTSNPVRKGRDTNLLFLLCEFLPKITSGEEAFAALTDAIYFALEQVKNKEELFNSFKRNTTSYTKIERLIEDLLIKSFGGETLALSAGALITLFSQTLQGNTRVEVHVVNQSGASSKEISDIDVYMNNQILYTIEIKDKDYAPQDVQHAVQKATIANCDRLMFITGPRGSLVNTSLTHADLIDEASRKGIYLTFFSYTAFTKMMLSLIVPQTTEQFFDTLVNIANDARMKQETLDYLIEVARKNSIIE